MSKSFATQIAAHLAPTAPVTHTVNFGGREVVLSQEQFEALGTLIGIAVPAAAPTPAPAAKPTRRGRKAKAEAPAVAPVIPIAAPAAIPAPAVPSTDSELLAAAKVQQCHYAAKAAVKAAGLAWNGVKGPGSKGGRFDNPQRYWDCYWAGYNAKAREIGVPESKKQ